jgi:protein-S-isoprenylcysteine O-methyltransferase Ste14
MDTRSTGEVVASLIVNAQAMIAKEVELLGLELKRIVGRKVAAVALLLVGALAVSAVVLLGAVTAAIALEGSFDERWMAWGVVTLAVAVLALVLLLVAARMLSRGWSPRTSRREATTTGEWLRDLGDELTGRSETPEADR